MVLVRCIVIVFLLFSLDHLRATQAENSLASPVAVEPVFRQQRGAEDSTTGTVLPPAKARKLGGGGGGGGRGGGSGGGRGGGYPGGVASSGTQRSFQLIVLASSVMTALLL